MDWTSCYRGPLYFTVRTFYLETLIKKRSYKETSFTKRKIKTEPKRNFYSRPHE